MPYMEMIIITASVSMKTGDYGTTLDNTLVILQKSISVSVSDWIKQTLLSSSVTTQVQGNFVIL